MGSKFRTIRNVINSWFVSTTAEADAESNDGLNMNALEERVLYSAVPLPVDMVESVDTFDAESVFETAEDTFSEVDAGLSVLLDDMDMPAVVDLTGLAAAATPATNEIVFVDQAVEGYEQLVDDILSNASNSSPEIVFIDSTQNGVEQITQVLREQAEAGNRFDALHIVSHGDDGVLNLGNETLDSSNVAQYNDAFQQWQAALSGDADLLIYGCDVAATEMGESFVDSLAVALDVDILASDDVTGHDQFGGDWTFEYQVGEIETDLIFSVDVPVSYTHLTLPTICSV